MMGTFKEEAAALDAWFMRALIEGEKEVNKLTYSGGLDNRVSRIMHPIYRERSQRLNALKGKYGIPLDQEVDVDMDDKIDKLLEELRRVLQSRKPPEGG